METLQRTANRGSISTGFDIDNSLKFEDDNDERMSKTISSTNQKTHTVSLWLKRTELGYRRTWGTGQSGTNEYFFYFDANDYFTFYSYASGYQLRFISNRVFRDTSAWYHLVFAIDTTQSTEANRVKIYVNGVQETSWSTSVYPSQNTDLQIFDKIYIGTQRNENPDFSGYISEFVYLDGTQAAVTDFGEFDTDTGIWKPIDVSGLSFGTNGCYLKFNNSSDLGEDANGGTSFTLSNITSADQATDTPTNNFATLNPLVTYYGSATINEGATKIQGTSTSSFETVYSTIAVTSGKWYFELVNLLGSTRNTNFGIVNLDTAVFDGTSYNSAGFWIGNMDTGGQLYYYKNGVAAGSESITFSQGDIIGLAFDADNGTLDFYLNNSNQEQFTGIPSGTFAFLVEVQGTGAPYIQANFGGYTTISIASGNTDANGYGNFEYAPPSGYYALCSKNLAEFG